MFRHSIFDIICVSRKGNSSPVGLVEVERPEEMRKWLREKGDGNKVNERRHLPTKRH